MAMTLASSIIARAISTICLWATLSVLIGTDGSIPGSSGCRASAAFLADGADRVALVVVRRKDQRFVGQPEEALKALVLRARVAVLKVGAARASDEQRIAREHHARLAVKARKVKADAALRVARGKHDLELE